MTSRPEPSATRVLLAFAAVYVIWGSTYLFIRIALDTMPPFVMAGMRFLIAGVLTLGWALYQKAPAPSPGDYRMGLLTGVLMLSAGNGSVVWAEQHTPSGRVALVVATTPVWMVLVDWARRGGTRPNRYELLGLAIGLGGVAILIGPDVMTLGTGSKEVMGELIVLFGACSWGLGSLVSKYTTAHTTPTMRTALQMLTAGVLLTSVALVRGEWATFSPAAVSLKSWASLAYLVTFGSLVAFTAYIWLLRVVSPAKAGTYAYVNPAVAVLLGWLFAGEGFTARTAVASAVIIAGVALVTLARSATPAPAQSAETTS
jgi:drug/metabolite transporter (DMT)-like permease